MTEEKKEVVEETKPEVQEEPIPEKEDKPVSEQKPEEVKPEEAKEDETEEKTDLPEEAATFHIGESKTGVERYVQLPTQAVTMLESLRMQTGAYPFASQKTRKPILQKQLTEQSWHLRQTDRMLDIPHWTPHDLRRTVRTGLSRLRCPSEVAEAVLGHARGGIEGTYDLHKYEHECWEWLQKWADHLDLISCAVKKTT